MRADLLALTPEALAALANLGLVKRAQRELDAGVVPALHESEDGTVTGTFADGVVARLPPGVILRQAPCTCGSSLVCRHRVAVALAYARWRGEIREAPTPAAWSPGDVEDATLLKRLGRRGVERASQVRRAGVTAEVRRPGPSDPVPSVRLPSCTVRFLVPGDLAYAQCDCMTRQDCEHVALAVWAFRAADARDPAAASLIVEIRDPRIERSCAEALELAEGLAADLLAEGVVDTRESVAQRFAITRDRLAAAGATWLVTALYDLEETLALYRARSGRYTSAVVTDLLAEIAARCRAARAERAELSPRFVLGQGEALETPLDQLRLVSLGARVAADGFDREVEVFLADPDSATVLVVRRRWNFGEKDAPDGPALGTRRITTGANLGALARGQVVTRVARRRANRVLIFGEGRGGMTSVTPQSGAWELLPAPLLVPSAASLDESWKARPPRLLGPRVLAENVHALRVAGVSDLTYSAARQAIFARLETAAGDGLILVKEFRAVSPHALDHLAAALAGELGAVRFVSGEVRRDGAGFVLSPLAVVCDRVVVPDLETSTPAKVAARPGGPAPARPGIGAALASARGALDEGVHHGLKRTSAGYPDRLREVAARLADHGLRECASLLEELARRVRAARATGTGESWGAATSAWSACAIRVLVAIEM